MNLAGPGMERTEALAPFNLVRAKEGHLSAPCSADGTKRVPMRSSNAVGRRILLTGLLKRLARRFNNAPAIHTQQTMDRIKWWALGPTDQSTETHGLADRPGAYTRLHGRDLLRAVQLGLAGGLPHEGQPRPRGAGRISAGIQEQGGNGQLFVSCPVRAADSTG